MAKKRRGLLPLLVVVVAALVTAYLARGHGIGHGSPDTTASPATAAPTAPAAKQALATLRTLTVAPPLPMTGYSRDRFPHWIDQPGGCDTRGVVLQRDGSDVVEGPHCRPTAGHWRSRYDNTVVSDDEDVDIDHLVPLANAWRSGAARWTTAKRRAFANDLKHPQLVAVSAHANRSKGDQDPSQWKPPYRGYWCEYARDWIAVKGAWKLTVTEAERSALVDMLRHCP